MTSGAPPAKAAGFDADLMYVPTARPEAQALRSALSRQPGSAELHYQLGLSLRAAGDLAGAIAAFRTALRFDPLATAVHDCLDDALRAAGQAAERPE
jgi:cytochrome c-type biogenesis protein CcmH/NrfG